MTNEKTPTIKRKINENSLTNCPKCNYKKPFKYIGLGPICDDELNHPPLKSNERRFKEK